jgi:hypothetical protein
VSDHLDDPRVLAAFEILGTYFGPAMSRIQRLPAPSV